MNEKMKITAENRWNVIFEDSGQWRVGIYKPESNNYEDINQMEKHSCPELFICTEGDMGLLIETNGKEEVIYLKPQEAIMVDDFHNGFTIDQKGYFIVVEQTDFQTEYKKR